MELESPPKSWLKNLSPPPLDDWPTPATYKTQPSATTFGEDTLGESLRKIEALEKYVTFLKQGQAEKDTQQIHEELKKTRFEF